jgi:hypothetical protein
LAALAGSAVPWAPPPCRRAAARMSNRSRAALVQVFLYDLTQTTLAYQMDGTKRTDDDDASTQQTIPMARTPAPRVRADYDTHRRVPRVPHHATVMR